MVVVAAYDELEARCARLLGEPLVEALGGLEARASRGINLEVAAMNENVAVGEEICVRRLRTLSLLLLLLLPAALPRREVAPFALPSPSCRPAAAVVGKTGPGT